VDAKLCKGIISLIILLLAVTSSGCREPVVEVDPDQLNLVDHYVEELTSALLDSEPDLLGWVREPYSDNLPLKYTEERISLLKVHQKRIMQICEIRDSKEFPTTEVLAKWQVVVVRGDDEWLLEGSQVVETLQTLEVLSGRVDQAVDLISEHDGLLDMEQSVLIIKLTDELVPAVEAIRAVFYK
jgi:hypothetical protein